MSQGRAHPAHATPTMPAMTTPALAATTEAVSCWIAGSLVRIEGLPPAVRACLVDLLRPFVAEPEWPSVEPLLCLRAVRHGRGDWAATGGDTGEVGCGSIARLLAHLEWRAASAALRASRDCLALHGAALARGQASVLLLAPSGTGKTTLTLGLMGRGWEPLTDDIVLVDAATLRASAFPRCFHIEAPSLGLLPQGPDVAWARALPGYARPLRWARGTYQPTAIILVRRDAQQPSMLFPMTQAEAASALLDASLRNELPGSQLARAAVGLAAGAARCCRLNNGSLANTLDLIEAACGM